MKDYLVKPGDVFGVEKRLQEIDPGYQIFYNKKMNRFEVHNLNQKSKDTLAIVVPFVEIDSRLIHFVRKTRVENARQLFMEIENNNLKLVEEENKKQAEIKEKIKSLKDKLSKS